MLQVAFSFQNSVKVTYVRHFSNFKCVLQLFIKTMISFSQRIEIALTYTSVELTCGTLIIKIKSSISACLIASRVLIFASNKPLCGTFIINLGKNNLCMLLQENKNIFCKNKIRIQNMY